MYAKRVSMHRGWHWLREGFLLWRRNPAMMTFLAFGYLLVLLLVSAIPVIGQPAASLLMPLMSVGLLNGCRAIDEGRRAGADILFSGFRRNVPALVAVGGIYLVASGLVLVVTMVADGGTLLRLMTGGQLSEEALMAPGVNLAMLLAVVLSTPVLMAYWFAPVLSGWWQLPATKSLFFSFFAVWMNWRPFLAYSIAVALFLAIVPGVLIAIVGVAVPALATLLILLLPIVLIPTLFASFYINTRDVFGLPGEVVHSQPMIADDESD